MLKLIDAAFIWVRRCPLCYRFTLFTRILLAAGFIPTGMVKLMGERFTLLPPDNPVGAFFEAMYQTGLYWRFIGLCQVVAGVLVLVPRVAHLGAMIFLGIILNIFVITVALGFRGTPIITGPMLLAAVYLCMWDFHRFRPILTESGRSFELPGHRLDAWERAGFWVFAVCLITVFLGTRSLLPAGIAPALIALGLAGGLLAAGRFFGVWWLRRRRAAGA